MVKLAFLIISALTLANGGKESWRHPHDMGFGDSKDDIGKKASTATKNTTAATPEFLCLQRHSKRLLKTLKIDPDTKQIEVEIKVLLDAYDIASIDAFAKLPINSSDVVKLRSLHNLEIVLEHMLEHVTEPYTFAGYGGLIDNLEAGVSRWLNALYIVLPVLVTLVIIISLWRGAPVWKVACFLFLVSCGWEWSRLYKQKLAEKIEVLSKNGNGKHCFESAGVLWSFPAHLLKKLFDFKDDECARYQEALLVDAYLEITPVTAVAETLTKLILHPLDHFGDKLGSFFARIISANTYVGAVGVVAVSFVLLALILIMVGGYTIRLPYYLGSFEPSLAPKKSLSEERLEKLLLDIERKLEKMQPPAITKEDSTSKEAIETQQPQIETLES